MHLLADIRRFVDTFCKLAAPKDAGELKKINLGRLRQTTPKPPDVEPREFYQGLNEQAIEGPIFQRNVIEYIGDLSDHIFPKKNRKQYTKWLANVLQSGSRRPSQNELMGIVDYLNAVEVNFDVISFDELKELSDNWHTTEFEIPADTGSYSTKDVVYDFGNGYTMVRVPPSDLEIEGNKMGHCVGGYCDYVNAGEGEIFSLRDSRNEPHVTIRTYSYKGHPTTVDEIKGKENKPPIEKYAKMVRLWLKENFHEDLYKDSEDYVSIMSDEEVLDLLNSLSFRGEDTQSDIQDLLSVSDKMIEIMRNNPHNKRVQELALRVFSEFETIWEIDHSITSAPDFLKFMPTSFVKKFLNRVLELCPIRIVYMHKNTGSRDLTIPKDVLRKAADQCIYIYKNNGKINRFGGLDSSDVFVILSSLPADMRKALIKKYDIDYASILKKYDPWEWEKSWASAEEIEEYHREQKEAATLHLQRQKEWEERERMNKEIESWGEE